MKKLIKNIGINVIHLAKFFHIIIMNFKMFSIQILENWLNNKRNPLGTSLGWELNVLICYRFTKKRKLIPLPEIYNHNFLFTWNTGYF